MPRSGQARLNTHRRLKGKRKGKGKQSYADFKMHKVMSEFKGGTLKSSSGQPVTNRKMAIAIGFSEGRRGKKRKRRGKK